MTNIFGESNSTIAPLHTYIGVEQIIARHARLTGDTGRNHNDVGTGQSLAEALIGPRRPRALAGKVAGGFGIGGDVAQIRRDAGSSDDIVAGELVNLGTELAKHGKRLADATSGTEDGNLGRGGGGGGEGPGGGGLGGGGCGHLPEGGSGGRSCGKHIVLLEIILETRSVIGCASVVAQLKSK